MLPGTLISCTFRPRPSSLAVASAALSPSTFGMANDRGPFETTSVTADPLGSSVPTGGSVRMTWSLGTSTENSSDSVTVRPNPVSVAVTLAAGWPVTSGMVTGWGPRLTTMVTEALRSSFVAGSGLWPITVPWGAASSYWRVACTLNPPRRRAAFAACSVNPPTSGTESSSGPADSMTETADPFRNFAPGPGEVRITTPDGTVVENTGSPNTTDSPAAFSLAAASLTDR